MYLDDLSQDGLKLLESAGNLEVVVKTGLKGEELRKTLLEFDGAICRSGVKITAEAMEGNTRLRAIARAGVGVDNIDVKAATRHGIVVMNTPGGNTISTAEQTLALMLGMSRNIAPAYQSLDRRPLGSEKIHGHAIGRQNAGHNRPGADRAGRGHSGASLGNANSRIRSFPCPPPGQKNWAWKPCNRPGKCCPWSII